MIQNGAPDISHDKLIAPGEIRKMARQVEQAEIRLHPEDAISVKLWVDKLTADNQRVFYKDKLDHPPPDSGLDEDVFVLCFQTAFQLDAYRRLGQSFVGLDATHNTSQYEGVQLFTIIVRDRWGHGM
jgi:hypothetical protein